MKIEKNKAWLNFEKLFDDEILDRYEWFLFEFGKRLTFLIHEELLGRISDIRGTSDYKKRLVVAELRQSTNRVWWAIAARTRTLTQGEYDPKETVLTVVPRFKLPKEDPIQRVLVRYGPWTPETLPYLPSLRQAIVVLKKTTKSQATKVLEKNKAQKPLIYSALEMMDLPAQDRREIYDKLKIIPDWEVEALRLEFGLTAGGKAHWRPAIKWGARHGIGMLMNQKDLIRAMSDSSFTKFRKFEHVTDVMTLGEMKAMQKFQNVIKKGL